MFKYENTTRLNVETPNLDVQDVETPKLGVSTDTIIIPRGIYHRPRYGDCY